MMQLLHKGATCLTAFALSGLVLAGCQDSGSQNATTTTDTTAANDTTALEQEMVFAPGEYIDWNTATLNGKQPVLGKTAELYRVLGQPDSLVSPNMNDVCVSFYDQKFQYAYFKHSQLEVYGDTAVIGTLDFRSNPQLALHTSTMRLNHTTTLDDVAKEFPEAVKGQHMVTVENLGQLTAIPLATGETPGDDAWILFFDKGKLVRIDYWMPC
ncbi:hypothetical protein HMJ29_12045 [Hymenobacter taeanensis]|uniref:Lipoprotein n=1 Tax=Hymenobacter taeanensis TaxID=2735321 RepID=A0A6M6BIM3_9BACT|nr:MULTISPECIES: hypothetical protein [Hymenobacter]QJX47634.1 hypothetical protein HMJ29_12045 [Hymenobacter taeanensis]UOQ82883.1 hypothetical protein MUN83_09030 [Hymenobacter sp. 5414T-23]